MLPATAMSSYGWTLQAHQLITGSATQDLPRRAPRIDFKTLGKTLPFAASSIDALYKTEGSDARLV
jgi:hypothetical protein